MVTLFVMGSVFSAVAQATIPPATTPTLIRRRTKASDIIKIVIGEALC